MSKVYETLKKKTDPTVEVYPNIETQNIPDGAITTDKIVDGNVTKEKLTNNLQNVFDIVEDVFDEDGNIDTEDIECDDLTVRYFSTFRGDVDFANDVTFEKIPQCDKVAMYAVKLTDNDQSAYSAICGYVEPDLSSYNPSDIFSALDIDKTQASDFSTTDIDILIEIFTNIVSPVGTSNTYLEIIGNDRITQIWRQYGGGVNNIHFIVKEISTSNTIYELTIDVSLREVTSITHNGEYFTIRLYPLKTML